MMEGGVSRRQEGLFLTLITVNLTRGRANSDINPQPTSQPLGAGRYKPHLSVKTAQKRVSERFTENNKKFNRF